MPTYNLRNKATGEEFEMFFSSWTKKDEYLAANPDIEQLVGSINIGDPTRLGLRKPDDAFRDRLRDIKSKFHGSNINTF